MIVLLLKFSPVWIGQSITLNEKTTNLDEPAVVTCTHRYECVYGVEYLQVLNVVGASRRQEADEGQLVEQAAGHVLEAEAAADEDEEA